MQIRKEDRYEFINDIISIWDNYKKPDKQPYWPEDLEEDFFNIMRKWEDREKKCYS